MKIFRLDMSDLANSCKDSKALPNAVFHRLHLTRTRGGSKDFRCPRGRRAEGKSRCRRSSISRIECGGER